MAHPQDSTHQSNACTKNRIQAHHRQDWDIHWIQSGCQARIQHGPVTISVPSDGLWWDTRIQAVGPGIKQSSIFMQRQLTKINRTINDPPTRHLHIWHSLWYILYDLRRCQLICFWIQYQQRKRYHPPLRPLCLVWHRNAHWHKRKTSKTKFLFFLPPGFFKPWTLPLTELTNSTLALQKKESDKKRRTHEDKVYNKCIETEITKVKGGFLPSSSTSSIWGATSHTLYETITTLTHA